MGKLLENKKSISKNIIGIELENGVSKDFDFSKDILEWSNASEMSEGLQDLCCDRSVSENKDSIHETFVTRILTKAEATARPDAEKAIGDEIKKFENFNAFERVNDVGQFAIKTRWVFTEDKEQSKGYNLKARLCMRGDREKDKDFIRADSPTSHKDSLKLALEIAANENSM